ncbi:MAG: hypothetical protein OXG38_06150 [Chloroflexi bacterium]|nr:hypothetical protein [Chloroflexota bacterium]
MVLVRACRRIGPRTWLLALLALTVALAAWTLPAGDVAAAAADGALAETPVLEAAGDEASDDPFHVSNAGLAIAIIVPGIFLIATGATVAWAVANRVRPGEDEAAADDDA